MTQDSKRYINPDAVKRINAEFESLRYATELRLEQARQRENCLLCLAGAFLRLRHSYGLTWEQIAEKIDGIADRGHAHKIARRESGLSGITYRLAATSVNALLMSNHDTIIDFPAYPETNRKTGR